MSRRAALVLVAAVWLLFFEPLWLRGHVIAAHDNRSELGLPAAAAPGPPQARALSDQSSVTLPELAHQLRGARSGWLATWNPHTQLGRPAIHVAGFSRAYFLTRLLALASDDPLRVYTAQVALHSAGAALFGFALFATLGLQPLACAIGALALSIGSFCAFWLCFGMFVAGICWTAGLLCAIARLARRPTLASALFAAFSSHALLLSAYPQQIVWHAWLAAGFALVALRRACPGQPREALRRAVALLACAAAGALSALPVYADLWLTLQRSARAAPEPEFFLSALPDLSGARALLFAAQRLDPLWLGNPFADAAPLPFDGVALTPPLALFALAGLSRAGLRRLWPPLAFCAGALLLTLSADAYGFALRWLGLGISRYAPLAGAWIPAVALAACGVDRLLRGLALPRAALAFLSLALVGILGLGWSRAAAPWCWPQVAVGVGLLAAALAACCRPRPSFIAAVAAASALHYGLPLRLMRAAEDVARSSPLSDELRALTADGSRYARISSPGRASDAVLPPNQEAWLGLRSIHSYDSLSPRAYQDFAARVSAQGTAVLGRHFRGLAPRDSLGGDELALAAVSTLVALARPVDPAAPAIAARAGGIPLLRFAEARPREIQWIGPGAEGELPRDTRALPQAPVVRQGDTGDRLQFRVTPVAEPSLLFVSQQYHPQWRAFSAGAPLRVRALRGTYLGVELPPGTRELELAFLPLARFAWLPQLVFAAAAAGLLATRVRRRRGAVRAVPGPGPQG